MSTLFVLGVVVDVLQDEEDLALVSAVMIVRAVVRRFVRLIKTRVYYFSTKNSSR